MTRKLREPDEFEEALDADNDLRSLFEALSRDTRLSVQPDGDTTCIFKVYRRGRTGPKEGFLRATTPFDQCKSYIDWSQQPTSCRNAFASIVKNDNNPDGSEIQHGTSVEAVVQAVQCYPDTDAGA